MGDHGLMDASTRIVVVGGGIVAASVAYHLARRGVSVIIVAADHAGAATDAGAGIICPWAEPEDDPGYRLSAEGARYYPELLAMLAGDGQADTGYARVGALSRSRRRRGAAGDRRPAAVAAGRQPRDRGGGRPGAWRSGADVPAAGRGAWPGSG